MARILFGILLAGGIIAQATFLENQDALEIVPDFVLVMLLVRSALRGAREGMAWAFGAGIALDVIALDALGTNAIALLPVVLLGSLASGSGFRSRLLMPIVAVMLATVLHGLILLLLRSGEDASLPFYSVGRLVVTQGFLNILLLPVIYLLVGVFGRTTERQYA